MGINAALKFSLNNKLIKKKDYQSIINHIRRINLPSNIKNYFSMKNLNKILFFMLKDKKNKTDKISLVLLKKIGSPLIDKEYKKKSLSMFLKNELSN